MGAVDPTGLSEEEIEQVLVYLWVFEPQTFEGLDPPLLRYFDVWIPGKPSGIGGIPANHIYIETYEGQPKHELADSVYHETQHAKDGFFKTLFKPDSEAHHDQIYKESAEVGSRFEDWELNLKAPVEEVLARMVELRKQGIKFKARNLRDSIKTTIEKEFYLKPIDQLPWLVYPFQ